MPLRDVFAAVFFIAFGLSIDIADLGPVAVPVAIAATTTLVVNLAAGIVTARLFSFNQRAAANVGLTVLGRGEFSLILATLALAAGLDDRLGPFIALYVLVLAVLSPLLAARSHLFARLIPDRLLRSRWRYVREETISTSCMHLDQIVVTDTDVDECRRCVELGDDWCSCGSARRAATWRAATTRRNRHATAHFGERTTRSS